MTLINTSSKLFTIFGLFVGLSITAASAEENFVMTDTMKLEAQHVVAAMEKVHIDKKPLSSLDPNDLIDKFLGAMDGNKLFLDQSQVNEFRFRFADSIPTLLRQGNIFPAFEMFKTYRQSVRDRINWVNQRLDQPFSFAQGDTFTPGRKDAPWPANPSEADALWEKRIKYEILNEILSQAVDQDADKLSDVEGGLQLAIDKVKKRYNFILDSIEEVDSNDVHEIYLKSFTQLFDPHSDFLSAVTMEELASDLNNSIVGIGATLTVEDGVITIKDLVPNGPADKTKLISPEDQILSVGEGKRGEYVDVVGMKLRKAVGLIRGKPGTQVRLLIRPAGKDPSARKEVIVHRQEVKLTANLAEGMFYEIPNKGKEYKIGLIEIPAFYGSQGNDKDRSTTTNDVRELIDKMKAMGMEGLILDLRRNPGGLLTEGISLTGLFIPIGPVVHVKDSQGSIREYLDLDPEIAWDGPLIVMASRYSASSSEIFAGALKSYNRALIVGDTSTHGKGTVQLLTDITPPLLTKVFRGNKPTRLGATKLTFQKWYLPDGTSTQRRGVQSHIVIPSINEFLPIGESDLMNAMAWDTIETLPWDFSEIATYTQTINPNLIDSLNRKSQIRQQSLEEFIFLKENINRFKQKQENKNYSLNLDQRKAERADDEEFRTRMVSWIQDLARQKWQPTDVKLDIVDPSDDQDAVLVLTPDHIHNSVQGIDTDKDDDIPLFDIYTRESIRIMSDYLDAIGLNSLDDTHQVAAAN